MSVGERYSSASVVGSCTTTRSEAALSSLSRNATVTGLPGSSFTQPVARSSSASIGHPDRADLFPRRHQQAAARASSRSNSARFSAELQRHAEDAVRDGVGQAARVHVVWLTACAGSLPFMRTVSTGTTSS